MNYPKPSTLHDHRFIGNDADERDKFRKVERRHVAQLMRLGRRLAHSLVERLNEALATTEFEDV